MPRAPSTEADLLTLFDKGRALTLQDISDQFHITPRHARRLLRQIRQNGVSIAERRDGRKKLFFVSEEHRRATVTSLTFTEEETLALAAASGAARAVLGATPLAEPARAAFARLLDRLEPHVFHIDLHEQPERWYIKAIAQTRIDPDVFATLLQGLNLQQSVRIDYEKPGDGVTHRKINPLCLAVIDRAVLITAWCHRDRDFRHFSLARITRAVLCDPASEPCPYFDRPEDFDPDLFYRPDFHGALTEGAVSVFRILVEPDVAHLFEEREYRPFQQIEEKYADGRLIVSYEGAGFEEWRSFFQSWGTKITVLEPPELVERMAEEARMLAARYGAPDG